MVRCDGCQSSGARPACSHRLGIPRKRPLWCSSPLPRPPALHTEASPPSLFRPEEGPALCMLGPCTARRGCHMVAREPRPSLPFLPFPCLCLCPAQALRKIPNACHACPPSAARVPCSWAFPMQRLPWWTKRSSCLTLHSEQGTRLWSSGCRGAVREQGQQGRSRRGSGRSKGSREAEQGFMCSGAVLVQGKLYRDPTGNLQAAGCCGDRWDVDEVQDERAIMLGLRQGAMLRMRCILPVLSCTAHGAPL